jgi:hypothetical protein
MFMVVQPWRGSLGSPVRRACTEMATGPGGRVRLDDVLVQPLALIEFASLLVLSLI